MKTRTNITLTPLEAITPYKANAKKHDDKQIELLAKGIEKFGFNQPIVIDKDGVIVAGHGRYLAAQKLKLDKVPTLDVSDLSETEVKAYRLADNKINEMTGFDMGLAVEELRGLDNEGFDIALTGFNRDLLIVGDEKDDAIPDNAPSRATVGDVWALGAHRVLCGDSSDLSAVSTLMGGVQADMVFTDPPYNVDYEGYTANKLKIKNDKKSTEDFVTDLSNWFASFKSAVKSGVGMYICYPSRFHREFQNALEENGFEIRNQIIWAKNTFAWGMGRYKYQHEPIIYAHVKGKSDSWYGDKTQNTLWNVNKPSRSEEHPTMKPVELITKALVNSSKAGDIVLDLFLGSGSTLIACEKAERTCYGMELDPKYVDVILKRWEDFTGKVAEKV